MAGRIASAVFLATLLLVGAAPHVATQSADTSVTFHKDVTPILQKNCQNCHRPGQIAPMSLLSYKDTRPWARSIKNAVVARKMLPIPPTDIF